MKMHHLVEAESIWALSQKGTVNLPQVKTLQDKLRAAGHDPGASDGWYGQKTANAVRSYQQANNLTVDGDAGPQTLSSLGMGGANTTPPAETPPAETPPAPAPRQAAAEPTARQAATEPEPTRTEPEPTRTEPEPTRTEPEPTRTEPDPAGEQSSMPDIDTIRDVFDENGFNTSSTSDTNESGSEVYIYFNPTREILKKYVDDRWVEYFNISSRDLSAGLEYWENNLKTSERMQIDAYEHASQQVYTIMVNELKDIAKELNIPANTTFYFQSSKDNWNDFKLLWTGSEVDIVREHVESIQRISKLAGL